MEGVYIPELKKADPKLFAIVVATVDGKIYGVGDQNVPFSIQSVSKPFVYALALQDQGAEVLEEKVGLNPTGLAYNSVSAVEELPAHTNNPLVNAGAIQVTSLIKGDTSDEKWKRVLTFFQELSDGKPYLGTSVYKSEMETNKHNRAIALLLDSYDRMYSEPIDAVDRYTRACSIMVTAKQLAMIGATLGNRGTNPWTHKAVMTSWQATNVLAVMTMNGLYEASGSWWVHVGLPAKSGVSGSILAIAPGKLAIVVFSPPLDGSGNSVRGRKVIDELSKKWHLHLLDL